MARGPLIACPHCDTLHERIDPGRRGQALCRCCGAELYRRGALSLDQWVALGWTSLIVFVLAQAFPIARVSISGLDVSITFWQALHLCWDRGYYSISALTGVVGFWFPLARIALTLWVLQAIATRRLPPDLAWTLRLLDRLTPWAMASVLVLSILVAIVKMAGLAHVRIEPGLLGFFALTFLMAGLSRWDARALWRHAEDAGMVPVSGSQGTGTACESCGHVQPQPPAGRCARCHARLEHRRDPDSSQVWALLLAAAIFYLPANLLPIMRMQGVLGNSDHTILGGVIELWRLGSWDLAVIVFVASVLVPVTKLLALGWLQFFRRPLGARVQRQRTRLYVFIEFIGQWSMLDVFVVVLLAALVNFPGLSQIIVGPAALDFGLVVMLTMAATLRYDPRRGWDVLREQKLDR
jgi:paraquat-inducible protein A